MTAATTVTVVVLPDRALSLATGTDTALHTAGAEVELPTEEAAALAVQGYVTTSR